jgi:hypothetical protein
MSFTDSATTRSLRTAGWGQGALMLRERELEPLLQKARDRRNRSFRVREATSDDPFRGRRSRPSSSARP